MKIQDLADIVAICETGSFRKAARRLGITQPTLSKRIAYLELQLATSLFDRSHGRSQPTAISTFIASRAADIVLQAENLIKEVKQVAEGRAGAVRIGLGPAPAHTFLPDVIMRCRQSAPQLSIETTIGTTKQLAELMQHGKIDIAICVLDTSLFKAPYETHQLLEEPIVVAARPGHAVFSKPMTNPAEFFAHQVVLPVLEPRYRMLINQLYGLELSNLSNIVQCSDYQVLIKLVLSGDFVTAGPRFVFREEVDKGYLKIMDMDKRVKHRIHLICNRSNLNYPALKNVIQDIHQVVHNLQDQEGDLGSE